MNKSVSRQRHQVLHLVSGMITTILLKQTNQHPLPLILTLWTQNLITTCVSLESIVHLTSMRTGTVASFHSLNRLPRSICQPQLQALPVSDFLVQLDRFMRIDAVIFSERTQRNCCFLLIIFAFLTSLTDCIWNLDKELYAEHL